MAGADDTGSDTISCFPSLAIFVGEMLCLKHAAALNPRLLKLIFLMSSPKDSNYHPQDVD